MNISRKEYQKIMEHLPSFEEIEKTMSKNNSNIPTRVKVGDIFYFDSNHWVSRREKNVYICTYFNLVGGKISAQTHTLKDAIRLTVSSNEDMISLGRVR